MSDESTKLLDETGWRILAELQADARLPYSELGRRVGLSAPAVIERVKRLEAAGVITGYRAEVNPAKLGLPLLAIIQIRASGEQCGRIGALVKPFPEVLECHRLTGDTSCVLKVAARSPEHLESLIDRLSPYGSTTTSLVLSTPVPPRGVDPAASTDSAHAAPRR